MKKDKLFYKKYIETETGINIKIIEEISINKFVFIFYEPENYSNPNNDERLKIVTNWGPLMIDTETNKLQIMSAVDFSTKFGDKFDRFEQTQNIELIISQIRKRKRINWSDFEDIFKLNDMDLFECVDMYSKKTLDYVELEFKNKVALKLIEKFLIDVHANYTVPNNNHFIVNLNIDKQ